MADGYEAEFDAIRRGRSQTPAQLTPDLIALRRALEAHILKADEEARIQGMSDSEFANVLTETSEELQAVRSGFAKGDASPVTAQLGDWLDGLHIHTDPASRQHQHVVADCDIGAAAVLHGSGP